MLEILIACDKFRGSLSAPEANEAIATGLQHSGLPARATQKPIADGGEGTLDALATSATERRTVTVTDPFGSPVDGSFLLDRQARRAVVEMASVAGHGQANVRGYDPDRASSVAVGELILAALHAGAREVVVAVGGSITVDGGAGALEALGAKFFDAQRRPLSGVAGRALADVARIDLSSLDPKVRDAAIVLAADVDNPLVGPNGAAAVFGPQKGVRGADVDAFDQALAAFDRALSEARQAPSLCDTPFAGAAGGMLVGLSAIAPTVAEDGFALVARHHDLPRVIAASDLVVTGEGSLDRQSLSGKGPVAIARMAKEAGVPAIAFAGRLAVAPSELARHGLVAFSIAAGPATLEEALAGGRDALEATAESAFRLLNVPRERRSVAH